MNPLQSTLQSIKESVRKLGTKSSIVKTAQVVMVGAFVIFQLGEAFIALSDYSQNENQGTFTVTFANNQQGIVADGGPGDPYRDDIEVDTLFNKAKIETGKTAGYFTTAVIQPNSLKDWDEVVIEANYSTLSDILVSVHACGSPTPIPGFSGLVMTGNSIDISGISAGSNPCLQVKLNLFKSGVPEPEIFKIEVKWNPLPAYLLSATIPSTVSAGGILSGVINYSVSYVNDSNTVIWTPLPSVSNGTIQNYTPGYNQNPALQFVTASGNGTFTSTGVTVNGITVPANSIYWRFSSLTAGEAGTLTYQLKTDNGWENGMTLNTVAHMDSLLGVQKTTDANTVTPGNQSYVTTIQSTPSSEITKRVIGTALIANQDYVVNAGTYSPTITYNVTLTNTFSATGRETLFNPIIVDDLSDIISKLNSECPVIPGRIIALDGGTLSGNTITWDTASGDLTHIVPGGSVTVSYTVNYTGCPSGPLEYQNTVTADTDKTTPISTSKDVQVGVDATPRGNFAKGDKVKGVSDITGGADDNASVAQGYGESFSYQLLTQNSGSVALGDSVMMDGIPAGVTFVAATLPSNTGGTIYYSEDVAMPSYTLQPGVGILTGGSWSVIQPTNPADVRWVLMYSPCINSPFFPAPISNTACYGKPSQVIGDIQVTINVPAPSDICLDTEIVNTGRFFVHSASPNISNLSTQALGSPLTLIDNEQTHASPSLAVLSAQSSVTGPSTIQSGQDATYSIVVTNTGSDTSTNTSVTINTPSINVNGVPTLLNYVSATGNGVNTAGLPNSVLINVGVLPVGASETVTVTYNIPSGILNNDSFVVNATIAGADNENCRTISAAVSTSSSVVSSGKLSSFKTVAESVVPGGDDIHYAITFRNTGQAPTTGTYVVDRIPSNAIFKEARTSGSAFGFNYTCPGCSVYFSNNPAVGALSATNPLDGTDINNYFVLGTEVTPGVWVPGFPADQTLWVAFSVDNTNLNPDLFPTGTQGRVGITVTNDENGSLPGIVPSPIGTFVTNAPAIFSSQLLQAIDNQVYTTILPNPGLRMTKTSDKDYIYAGEGFNWNIAYYNDSGNDDTAVTITDTLPYGVTLSKVYHTWNADAVNGGANPSSEVEIYPASNPNITVVAPSVSNGFTTEIELNVVGLRGDNLGNLEGGTIRYEVVSNTFLTTNDQLLNTAEGCFENPSGSFCIFTQDDIDIANADLWMRKQVDITNPIAGEDLNYTLIVSNEAPHDALNVEVTDTLPAGLCYDGPTSTTTSGWTIGEPQVTGGPCAIAPTTLTWNIANGNNLNNNAYDPEGTIPGNSSDIYIRYSVHVDEAVGQGVSLLNGACVSTTITEDTVFANCSNATITTPLPDPYVTKSGQPTVFPGETTVFTITYGNSNRETAQNVYVVDTFPIVGYPNYATHPNSELKFVSAVGTQGESFYYHDGPLSLVPPPFSPGAPTSGGWSSTSSSSTAFMAIVPSGPLPGDSGPFSVTVTFQAIDPTTDINQPVGLTFTNRAEIFTSSVDVNSANNIATAITSTPGLDLAVTKVGSSEGGFPGVAPGTSMTYTVTVYNQGTVDACGVYVTDTLSTQLLEVAPYHNFNTLSLTNSLGDPVLPHDTNGNPISSTVGIDYSAPDRRWNFGSSGTTDYTDVCMPPGSRQVFQVYAEIAPDTANPIPENAVNIAFVGEDSADPEDIMLNNTALSSVTIYRADMSLDKQGYSCGPDTVCGTADDSTTDAEENERIQYTLTYDNVGNIDAENVILNETIPVGTCFEKGSVDTDGLGTLPTGATIQYSNDSGATYTYNPTAGVGTDCAVTNFRVVFNAAIPAPANFDSENTLSEFVGTRNGVSEITKASGAEVLELAQLPLQISALGNGSVRSKLFMEDLDLDVGGVKELIIPTTAGVSIFRNNSTPGVISIPTLYEAITTSTTASMFDAGVGDYDGDGRKDIYVPSYTSPNLSKIFKNSSTPGNLNVGTVAHDFAFISRAPALIHDFDLDNDFDFIQTAFGQPSRVSTNTSIGGVFSSTFFTQAGFAPNITTTQAPVKADFNGDGLLDVVYGSLEQGVRIYENTSTSGVNGVSFSLILSDVTLLTNIIKTVDMDGDNDLDIIISGAKPSVIKNTTPIGVPGAALTFDAPIIYHTPVHGGSLITVGDVNNDTLKDIVIAARDTPQLYVYLNQTSGGNISFVQHSQILNYPRRNVVIRDLNADGWNELIMNGPSAAGVSSSDSPGIYVNTPNGTLPSFGQYIAIRDYGSEFTFGSTAYPVVYDFDNNTKPDILFVNLSSGGQSMVLENRTVGNNFNFRPVGLPYGYNLGVSTEDANGGFIYEIDGDGREDIILADTQGAYIYKNESVPDRVAFGMDRGAFQSSGIYSTYVTAGASGLVSWDKLQVAQTIPAGTDIKYSIYSIFDGSEILAPTSLTSNFIDLSFINPVNMDFELRIEFTSTIPSVTPMLDAWRVTYLTLNRPTIMFRVVANNDLIIPTIDNVASITTTTAQSNTTNDTDTYHFNVRRADVGIEKTADLASVVPGGTLTYTLTYINNGPRPAFNTVIVDTLDLSILPLLPGSITSPNTSGGQPMSCLYSGADHNITCAPVTLQPGETGTITIVTTVSVSASEGSFVTNVAAISTTTSDTNPINDEDTISTFIGQRPNVYTTKAGPPFLNIDQTFTYTIDFGNDGNLDALGVTVTDTLDPNVSFVGVVFNSDIVGFNCVYNAGPHTVVCLSSSRTAPLISGHTGTIDITVHVNNDTDLLINNAIIHNEVEIVTDTLPEVRLSDNFFELDIPIVPKGSSSINGYVFVDSIPNTPTAQRDTFESIIENVDILLAGVDLYDNVLGPDRTLYPSEYISMMAELVSQGVLSGGPYTTVNALPSNYIVIPAEQTNSTGLYSFAGLSIGTYVITESNTSGFISTGSNAGYRSVDVLGNPQFNPAIDGKGSSEDPTVSMDMITEIILGEDQIALEYNFGEINGLIGNQVFLDLNGDAVFGSGDSGIAGVTLSLYTDLNTNGVIDAGEPSRGTITNASGVYFFSNLELDQAYIVRVTDTGNVLGGYNAVLGTSGINNHGQNPLGYPVVITSASPSNITADFGYATPTPPGCTVNCDPIDPGCTVNCGGGPSDPPTPPTGSIGNQVFHDENGDGIFNGSDVGIPDIEVILHVDDNRDGIINDTGSMVWIRQTSVDDTGIPGDQSGLYQFVGLDISKQYIVEVSRTSQYNIDILSSMTPSLGPNQTADNHGKNSLGYIVTLSSGSPSNQTADFGYKGGTLVETGRDRENRGIVIGASLGAILLLAGIIVYRKKYAKIN